MKVLLIHNRYQQHGGEDFAVSNQAELLRQRGHTVIHYFRDNNEVLNYSLLDKIRFFPNTVYSIRTVREIRSVARRERPDVAHIHNVFPLISPSVYTTLAEERIPIVQTIHNYRFMCPNALFFTQGKICERCKSGNTLHAVRHRCYKDSTLLSGLYAAAIGLHRQLGTFSKIARFIALTPFSRQILVNARIAPPEKISELGNFLPDPLFEPGLPGERSAEFVFIGRLVPEKGVQLLIEAMRGLPQARLAVLGSGPMQAKLEEQARRQQISNVEFLGYIAGEAKMAHLRRTRALVLPSLWYESLSFVILEAMCAATPVIVPRHGGIPQIVEKAGCGLVFFPGDAADLGDRLKAMLADPGRAAEQGMNGRRFLEANFSAQSHYRRLVQIYQGAIRG